MQYTQIGLLRQKIADYQKENRTLEFKSNYQEADRLGKYISALSNAACLDHEDFAYLYFGVEDGTLELKGTTFQPSEAKKGNQALELYLRECTHPKINFQIEEFQDEENRHFVVFRIPAAYNEPTCFKGKSYIRVDSHVTELAAYTDWVRAIYNARVDWTKEIVEDATIADLDEQALKIAREGFCQRSPDYANAEKTWDTLTFLNKARLTIDGKITRTTLLLLGKEESVHRLGHIAQIVWKLNTETERASEIFTIPFLTSTSRLLEKIRNYRIKIYPRNSLIPAEVWRYDTVSILEALHNCIVHQDYSCNERIVVTEESGQLIFENAGSFYDGKPEDYYDGKKTPKRYRNTFLKDAMLNLKMIDTMGYGIHNMYLSQKRRFLPLPYYEVAQENHTSYHLPGKVIDQSYSLILMEHEDLDLDTTILLDHVQRKLPISKEAAKQLRKQKLIEGKFPNLYVSRHIAHITHKEAEYSKLKGLDDSYYRDLILAALKDHKALKRTDFNELLTSKLPEILSAQQKENKISNLLKSLKTSGKIYADKNRVWHLQD